MPHNLPKNAHKLREVLGNISENDHCIVYDQIGLFSSARGMYTLQAFGHQNVSVLDGGLPMWIKLGYTVEEGHEDEDEKRKKGTSSLTNSSLRDIKKRKDIQWSLETVKRNVESKEYQLVDLRPKGRFDGDVLETRPNTRSGHVPGSFNLPFVNLLRNVESKDVPMTLESEKKILAEFKHAGIDLDKKMAFMCGSGLTACIGRLALEKLGMTSGQTSPIYDGSWAEYGSDKMKTEVLKSTDGRSSRAK